MRLSELNPEWFKNKILILDCPKCKNHRLKIPTPMWAIHPIDFSILTMKPSYQSKLPCKVHFSIINGEIVP